MTTETFTFTEFLTARLDEDEAVAHAAASTAAPPWWWGDAPLGARFRYGLLGRNPFGHPAPTWIIPSASGDMWPDRDTAAHIARHDPARVLAEVAAKRRIVELHGILDICFDDMYPDAPYPCDTLRALASVYADHPDYRQEWA